MDFDNPRAPAIVGQNLSVKSIDKTAEIVMQDYGMTDLRSDVRPTETAAPKLPPVLQAQADNFFGGGRRRRDLTVRDPSTGRGHNITMKTNPALLGQAAIRGGFRQEAAGAVNPVGALHQLRNEAMPSIRTFREPPKN